MYLMWKMRDMKGKILSVKGEKSSNVFYSLHEFKLYFDWSKYRFCLICLSKGREKGFTRFLWERDNKLRHIHRCIKVKRKKKEECCLISEKKNWSKSAKKIIWQSVVIFLINWDHKIWDSDFLLIKMDFFDLIVIDMKSGDYEHP